MCKSSGPTYDMESGSETWGVSNGLDVAGKKCNGEKHGE